ncbi:MAG TPA: Panacea domain-containing protein, partial [Candidatus Kapabacteria bacterium]|nr:Panacea domain-containing protein [Candidatus Kapabacteria bacterium]
LYIADRSRTDELFGATKLNKILFFSDFLSYGLGGKPITGATYQKLEYGPAPKELKPIAREIVEEKSGVFIKRPWFNYFQTVLIPTRPANRNLFRVEEIDLVDEVIHDLEPRDATETSNLSHVRSEAWQIADIGEVIPYEAVFLSTRKPTSVDLARAQELARKHGWLGTAK